MSSAVATQLSAGAIEKVLIAGDLKALNEEQRLSYYRNVCDSLGLNPLTKPFAFITLNGKLTLYALRDATDQLRKRDKVSVRIVARESIAGVYVVTARATLPDGREDESTGAVAIGGDKGEKLANAMMKAETKAKRRVTLSIVGLGFLDETEVDAVPAAKISDAPALPTNLPKTKQDGEIEADGDGQESIVDDIADQADRCESLCHQLGWNDAFSQSVMEKDFGVKKTSEMSKEQLDRFEAKLSETLRLRKEKAMSKIPL